MLFYHLLDVVIVVENDTPDFCKGQGSVYAEVLKCAGGKQEQPPDFI